MKKLAATMMTPLCVTEPVRMKMRAILPFGEDALQVVGHEQMVSLRARTQINIIHSQEMSIYM